MTYVRLNKNRDSAQCLTVGPSLDKSSWDRARASTKAGHVILRAQSARIPFWLVEYRYNQHQRCTRSRLWVGGEKFENDRGKLAIGRGNKAPTSSSKLHRTLQALIALSSSACSRLVTLILNHSCYASGCCSFPNILAIDGSDFGNFLELFEPFPLLTTDIR